MGADHIMSHRTQLVVAVFLALAVFNAAEVIIKILRTFRSYRGVYFGALMASSVGIVLHALGYFFRNFNITKSLPLEIVLVGPGGMLMITGQSIMLYSRLHLISRNHYKDYWLLTMILFNLLVVQVGATTLYAGSQSAHPEKFLSIYRVWEPIQVTFFFVQECTISGIYMYRTYLLVQDARAFRKDPRNLFRHLILVNILIILLDITILVFQFAGLYEYQTSWKTLSYSIKLKLEFYILGRLIEFLKNGLRDGETGRTSSNNDQLGTGIRSVVGPQGYDDVSDGGRYYRVAAYALIDDHSRSAPEDVPNTIRRTTEITVDDGTGVDVTPEGIVREPSRQSLFQ